MDAPTLADWLKLAGAIGGAAGAAIARRIFVARRRAAGPGVADANDPPDASGGAGGGFATRVELEAERVERRAGDAASLQHVIALGESVEHDVDRAVADAGKAVTDAAVARALAERG